ncbi:MAG: tRNA (adenosine(37)-N6)-threonylcarbamoyltransferase complex dimerization subunit type 1 TsaB [Burkholderiales bacterium]|nr:tRNA (adenosine(37)-N6)-threonylcarbamoyltransferase complex dimerization subunit type 1 TsaB [Burkholderiales bacterium]
MNLLALETSTERLSIAILRGDASFARDIDAGQRHSELALPLLHELLAAAKCTLRELDAIAFGQGPGSFTGVRIACGLSQGLAFGIGKSLVPVPTQMALAEQTAAAQVLVAIDARMGEIYFAAYRRDLSLPQGWKGVVAPMLARPDALPALEGHGWCATGSAFDVPALSALLAARYVDQIERVVSGALPRALDVARIAARQLKTDGIGSAIKPEFAAPLYLRNKVAMTIDERREHRAAKADTA